MLEPQRIYDEASELLDFLQNERHLSESEAVAVMGVSLQALIATERSARFFMQTLADALDKSLGTKLRVFVPKEKHPETNRDKLD